MFMGARYAQKSVFANFCRRFASSQKPSQAPYVQIPYPNRPFGGVNRPKHTCEFFVAFAQFFSHFSEAQPLEWQKWVVWGGSIYCIDIARSASDVATDAAEREQRTSLLVLCRAARRKSHECGLIYLCCRIKKLKISFYYLLPTKGSAKIARW